MVHDYDCAERLARMDFQCRSVGGCCRTVQNALTCFQKILETAGLGNQECSVLEAYLSSFGLTAQVNALATAANQLQRQLPSLSEIEDLRKERDYLRGLSCVYSSSGQSIEDWLSNQCDSQ
jgi:hypothetical protein